MSQHESEQRRRRLPAWFWLPLGALLLGGVASAAWTLWPSTGGRPEVGVAGERFVQPAASPPGTGPGGTGNSGCGQGNGGPNGSRDCSNPGHPITVTGQVLGPLYPGVVTAVRVTVHNPGNQDLTLTAVHGVVGTPSATDCKASWFAIADFSGTTAVGRQSTATIDLPFRMLNDSVPQDACKDATIPVSFSATATGGSR